jgi:hypothetical protein
MSCGRGLPGDGFEQAEADKQGECQSEEYGPSVSGEARFGGGWHVCVLHGIDKEGLLADGGYGFWDVWGGEARSNDNNST